jgi:glycerol-3-phosphate acyltransferase PlsY
VRDAVICDVVLVVVAYLLGSVPFGVVVARARGGMDLRRVGSGNIGATNVLRVLGKSAAGLTLLGDIGKGALAVGLGRWIGISPTGLALIGLAAVAGHLCPVFAGFRGGKGVATSLGVVLAAMPAVGGLLLLIWLAVAVLWRYSSLAALMAATALPVLAWWLDGRAHAGPERNALSHPAGAAPREHRPPVAGHRGKIGQRSGCRMVNWSSSQLAGASLSDGPDQSTNRPMTK